MPNVFSKDSGFSIQRFFAEISFLWRVSTTLIILFFLISAFHLAGTFIFPYTEPGPELWFHFIRDVFLALLLVGWTLWTLYAYRKLFREKITRQELQFQRLLSAADEAVVLTGADSLIAFWNPAAERLLGWKENEVLGRKLEEFVRFPDLKGGRDTVQECLDRDGNAHVVNVSELILEDEKGVQEMKALLMRDLSTWLVHKAQMERSERLASLGHMAAGVAHEIGNPLASISGIIQLLQRRSTDDYQKEQLARVRQNIDRISKIVRDMVDFSRSKSPEVARVSLEEIALNAVGLIKHDARSRNIRFEVHFPPELPFVKAVADQLSQVLINLILNAVDALENHPNPLVRISAYHKDKYIFMEVEDNGKGISAELHNRIFEPFFTTKDPGKGTGLGLSVVYHILQSSGAGISLKSKPGETIFTLQFSPAA